ncbi:MAG: histidinol-phosphate transaminase [Candidatus Saganbacteria bacterium]|nr:histidinol-phosphate transaminase [Candidatus Saganbacteria bacterium]
MPEELTRPAVGRLAEYLPGKTPAEPGIIKLASNENPFGPSPKALEAIAAEGAKLQIYPDQKSLLLREALGAKFGLPADCVACGNGEDDLLQIIAATYLNPGEEVIIARHAFAVYELVSRLFDAKPVFVALNGFALDLDGIAAAVTGKTKLIFLTNPNNPTGASFSAGEFAAFLAKVPPQALIIVDEAYAEFAERPDFPETVRAIRDGRNVMMLRTFSKFYGLAGLRLGYALAKKELTAPLFKAKMPFNVSRLAQAGGLAALGDRAFLEKTFRNNSEQKKYLYGQFDKLNLDYKKTEANFIFIGVKRPADEVFLALLKQRVVVRPLTSFGFPDAVRVSIGTREQNEKLVAALKAAI